MKYILTIITILAFSACSQNNAFDNFQLNEKQELSINSLQSSKIKNLKDIDGIFSAIYLNEIYPQDYNYNEYFFIYFYTKSSSENFLLRLNKNLPIKIKKLSSENRFTNLIISKNKWNNYYLVVFKKESKTSLNLLFENNLYVSDLLNYQKD